MPPYYFGMKSLSRSSLAIAILVAMTGCSASKPSSDVAGLERAEESIKAPTETKAPGAARESIALLIGQDVIGWSQIQPLLAETAGPVLEEIALDHILKIQCAQAGITISSSDITLEERRLVERLSSAANADPEASSELLDRVRNSRGLGPRRYQALLQRNAMLRKMVASEVTVTPAQLEQALAVRHGPKFKGRVLLIRSEREAAAARAQIAASSDPKSTITSLAAASSETARVYPAGMVEPISAADPTYPSGLRAVIAKMKPGEVSPVIALDRNFAVFVLEEILPGLASTSNDSTIEADVRDVNERMAMERKANQLLEIAGVNVLDADLRWSWERRNGK